MIGSRKTVPPMALRICGPYVQIAKKREDRTRRETYGGIWRTPHLFEVELFHACFVWSDGRAFDTDVVLEDRLCGLDRHLVFGLKFT